MKYVNLMAVLSVVGSIDSKKSIGEIRMNMKKRLILIPVGMLFLVATAPSHASGGVYGNIGYNDFPWSILVGYNDYGNSYDRGHRHGPRCGHHYKRHNKRHHNYGYHNGHRNRHHSRDRHRDRR